MTREKKMLRLVQTDDHGEPGELKQKQNRCGRLGLTTAVVSRDFEQLENSVMTGLAQSYLRVLYYSVQMCVAMPQ